MGKPFTSGKRFDVVYDCLEEGGVQMYDCLEEGSVRYHIPWVCEL